ncbi:anthrone oxygenase family protein [Flavimaricola marinus]|uniref:DUF1772 domain-containing protein n=1 Tax=Flavimaricola marinus TaxID=1819565 RepID=A0A238LAL1_9RHOB|nr:anthrone oxygenase family protein [Flavimaricola marinus]SMY06465.1 hypothetical protein LOM8899_00590 [Flavimaricola marinus]
MRQAAIGMTMLGVLFAGAIFGFFYAWVCSTMWGLDAADPRVAMAAMQAMNASVRNAVFAPAFFGTPFVLLAAAALAYAAQARGAAGWLLAAGLVYLGGGMIFTILSFIPMNEALGATPVPASEDEARVIWTTYSQAWQPINQIRAALSGVALLLAAVGLYRLAGAKGAVS